MAVTTTTRLGITRWSTGGDAFTRTQMDTSHSNLESRVPIYLHDTFSNRPAAGTVARFFFATDTYRLYYDDGVAWRDVNATYTGAVIAGAYGGTGVANTGKTITVSGNTSIGSGTDTVTFTTSGATSVALPTSGTLITNGVTALNSLIDVDTSNTATHSLSLGTGATVNAATKTVNIGTGGVAGSLTNITLGSSAGTNTITLNGTVSLGYTGDTATTATHYFVETGTDGYIRPKTLANVRTEIVTTSAVNSAAATTVGTITSGTWNGTAIDGQRGGTGVANTGKTITVSGNTVIGSNTDTVTFVTSGATSVTLPTSGTLVNTGVSTLSSLVSVGTITTGTWNATVITGQYGGTGVANTGKTISVSGNTSIGSSTHTVTLATTNNTNVTLPTSGTLVNDAVQSLNSLTNIDTTSTAGHTTAIASGATANGATKIVNIGTGGVSGSQTTVTLGSTTAGAANTINVPAPIDNNTASHYFYETATDGSIRRKTIANVRSEVVTTSAVNSAAATTVGTITTGSWNAGASTLPASNLTGTVPSTVLANSTLYIGTTGIALNAGSGTITSLAGLTGVTATTFTGALSGNASTASKWASTISVTIGSTSRNVDGSASATWSLADIGAAPAAGSSNIVTVGTIATGTWNAGTVTSSSTITATTTISASGLAGSLLSSASPLIDGTAAAGTSTIPSRQDHVHPTDDNLRILQVMGVR